MPHVVLFTQGVRSESSPAGITNILIALVDLIEIGRQAAMRREYVDLKDHATAARRIVHHVLQRRVGKESSVPILFAVDLDWGKARRQRPAGHDVLGTDRDLR